MKSGWWRSFFREATFPLAELTNDADTRREVRELVRLLPCPRGSRILDVACGIGRHAIPLAKEGFEVTGVDWSSSYLWEARRRASRAKVPVRFLRRDMRALGLPAEFDAVTNLWTSFGYFPKESDDLRALRSMRAALKPGGWIFLEIADADLRNSGKAATHFGPKRPPSRMNAATRSERSDAGFCVSLA